jgi:hypothetical protein
MSELILADETGEAEGGPLLVPSSDIDALRQRFLPDSRKDLTIDRYQHAGIEIIGMARDLGQILGELTELGWQHLRPHITISGERIKDTQRTRWAEWCARMWGCSRATVTKAWLIATSDVDRPEDMSLTTFYEILAGCDDPEEVDRVVGLAIDNDWRSYHIRLIKRLQDAGLLRDQEWVLPRITRKKQTLYVSLDGERKPFATLQDDSRLGKVGIFLLTDGAGIKTEEKTIDANAKSE